MKQELESHGHEMTFDWMNGEDVRPYQDNQEMASKTAKMALDGAKEAELFILIAEPAGTGMYVEFGAAIAEQERTGIPKIFVLGDEKYCSMFNFHPAVTFADSLEEILEKI